MLCESMFGAHGSTGKRSPHTAPPLEILLPIRLLLSRKLNLLVSIQNFGWEMLTKEEQEEPIKIGILHG